MTISWEQHNRKGTGNNLIIVDGINLAMRFKHRGHMIFGAEYLATINSLAMSYGAKDIIHLSDWGKSTYRKELLPTYKGDREGKREVQTAEETQAWNDFFDGYTRAVELVGEAGHCNIKLKGIEADDLAAFFAEHLYDRYDTIWLISTDADWDQLLNDKVKRWAYTSQKEFTLENFYDEHGCDNPEEYTHVKAIQGDRGDSVPGVDGIGVKRAYNLVREFGSVHDLVGALPLAGKQLYIQNLNKSAELLLKNLELMDLPSYYFDAIDHAAKTYNIDYLARLNEIVEEVKSDKYTMSR
jgi:5'-3' exonuclease